MEQNLIVWLQIISDLILWQNPRNCNSVFILTVVVGPTQTAAYELAELKCWMAAMLYLVKVDDKLSKRKIGQNSREETDHCY